MVAYAWVKRAEQAHEGQRREARPAPASQPRASGLPTASGDHPHLPLPTPPAECQEFLEACSYSLPNSCIWSLLFTPYNLDLIPSFKKYSLSTYNISSIFKALGIL